MKDQRTRRTMVKQLVLGQLQKLTLTKTWVMLKFQRLQGLTIKRLGTHAPKKDCACSSNSSPTLQRLKSRKGIRPNLHLDGIVPSDFNHR
jgi:hypothetical protein